MGKRKDKIKKTTRRIVTDSGAIKQENNEKEVLFF